jgi:FkbM family methyltransferase
LALILNFYHKLNQLKQWGITIENVLDIGAYRGHFTYTVRAVWPNAKIQQFEADERQKQYLREDAHIAVLGDSEREVDFYTIPDSAEGSTTGSSIYRENTIFYQRPIVVKKQMQTLDSLVDTSGDWSKGLVKIDTQGSELDILRGAKNFLENQKPQYILLECSIKPYNDGAPLISQVTSQMLEWGYEFADVFDMTYEKSGQLLQMDVLFRRKP